MGHDSTLSKAWNALATLGICATLIACSASVGAPEFEQGATSVEGTNSSAGGGLVLSPDAVGVTEPSSDTAAPGDASMVSDDATAEDAGPQEDAGSEEDTDAAGPEEDGGSAPDAESPDAAADDVSDDTSGDEDVSEDASTPDEDGGSAEDTGPGDDATTEDDATEPDAGPEPACTVDADCEALASEEVCRSAACEEGVCVAVWAADGTACDDGEPCTADDQCKLGECVAALPFDCNDGDPCTDDDCWDGVGCVQTPVICDDGEPCTLDACDPNIGCVTKEISCPPSDNPCISNECELFTGTCVEVVLEDGVPCDDEDSCTAGEVCSDATCVGESVCACQSDEECAGATTNLCLGESVCDLATNTCVPDPSTAVVCPSPEDACAISSCDPETGQCVLSALAEGTVCALLGPCDASATCTEGSCLTTPKVCNDDDVCTVDSCDPVSGECVFTPAPGTPCDDGDKCTSGETCGAEGCGGGESVCECESDADCEGEVDVCVGEFYCADNNTCQIDPSTALQCAGKVSECKKEICSSEEAACILVDLDTGTTCDAGTCFEPGGCFQGDCLAFEIDCSDGDPCTDDGCDAEVGDCVNVPQSDVPCDDENACTEGDTCDSGICIPGDSVCECESGADCAADWDYCLGIPVCDLQTNTCEAIPGTASDCAGPVDACTALVCQPSDGECVLEALEDGSECDDGEPCTSGDSCQGGACTSGPQDLCDDGDACTTDACVSGIGCKHETFVCDDDDVCTNDACDPLEGCAHTLIPCLSTGKACHVTTCDPTEGCSEGAVEDGVGCSDGDACTFEDACVGGVCVGLAQNCDDDNVCTADACVDGDCQYTNEGAGLECDDGSLCTEGDACNGEGKCLGSQKACDDGEACTSSQCVDGECETLLLTGPACDDGEFCTGSDQCLDGACEGSATLPEVCDDEDPCTTDACAEGACVHEAIPGCGVEPDLCEGIPAGGACDDGDSDTVADICLLGQCRGFRAHEYEAELWDFPIDFGFHAEAQYVAYAEGSWYASAFVEGTFPGNDWSKRWALVRLDDPDNPEVLWDTVSDVAITGLHDRVAVDAEGGVWWLEDDAWSLDSALNEEVDAEASLSVVTTLTRGKEMRLWLAGDPFGGANYWSRRCDVELKANGSLKNADCAGMDWPFNFPSLPGGIAAVSDCEGNCLDAGVVIAHNTAAGGGQYYNDIVYSAEGLSGWFPGFVDNGAQPQQVTDVAGYGTQQYLVVGTGGHMRYRDGFEWSYELSSNWGNWEYDNRDFGGAWAGAEVVVASAKKRSGNESLELWTCPQALSPANQSNWRVHTLVESPGGNDPKIKDVWGLEDGTMVVLASGRLEDSWQSSRRALFFIRTP